MENQDIYKKVITELIQKQIIVLGSDIALLKAKSIKGLAVNERGEVTDLKGNSKEILQRLADEYMALSGQVFKSILMLVLQKYPDIIVNMIQ
ncbi:hypothetical protein COT69_03085 [candidate division WWE3 bacterium CG09_land_8_20_14_0_10_39_24]|uniref:Uncharacterized protein n=2 Tax=Katanobacteria TaxID=422282 RepID=A0A2G9XC66_UNCKA|nr:MAG: hypothetical protein AUJ94_01795 [bacterium CG2_30_40_12]OJI08180.1 MAG: hypothetical protein BK003_02930 [bacterium CG09_39_24]PIP04556.1 MAG: hypothetical protein COX53_01850 [candidate division WWE3 bacterium CG23_combo_of_CG06-09_8_20_14_all_40_14]PIS12621.1 MAG: hypothetical protein COT69_03085 [candidate division WWE3 bacterium CG09_land_8_20_14_0_10_39_24]PJE51998.1 MAG: hypothetical protein COV27_00830 [candidate division WWE3 bacterium CG10_big_fil_rev_8_21_14_0_10_39_14]